MNKLMERLDSRCRENQGASTRPREGPRPRFAFFVRLTRLVGWLSSASASGFLKNRPAPKQYRHWDVKRFDGTASGGHVCSNVHAGPLCYWIRKGTARANSDFARVP